MIPSNSKNLYTDMQKIMKYFVKNRSCIYAQASKNSVFTNNIINEEDNNISIIENINFNQMKHISDRDLFFYEKEQKILMLQNLTEKKIEEKINYIKTPKDKIGKINLKDYTNIKDKTKIIPLKEYELVNINKQYPQLITKIYSKPLIIYPEIKDFYFEKHVTPEKFEKKTILLKKPYEHMESIYNLIMHINLEDNFILLKNSMNVKSWHTPMNNIEEIIKIFDMKNEHEKFINIKRLGEQISIDENLNDLIKGFEKTLEYEIDNTQNEIEEEEYFRIFENINNIKNMSSFLINNVIEELNDTRSNLKFMIGGEEKIKIDVIPVDNRNIFYNIYDY